MFIYILFFKEQHIKKSKETPNRQPQALGYVPKAPWSEAPREPPPCQNRAAWFGRSVGSYEGRLLGSLRQGVYWFCWGLLFFCLGLFLDLFLYWGCWGGLLFFWRAFEIVGVGFTKQGANDLTWSLCIRRICSKRFVCVRECINMFHFLSSR